MKKHKMKITRPEALLKLLGGDHDSFWGSSFVDMDLTAKMKKNMYETTPLCYCVYTALMKADIDSNDITSVTNDGEAIAITFKNKSLPKDVKDMCDDLRVRFGNKIYEVSIKVRDKYLIASTEIVEKVYDGLNHKEDMVELDD